MSARPSRYHWVILAMGTLVVFGSLGLARFGYSIVLPSMQKGLGFDNTHAGALASANLAGYLTLALIGGALAARFGPRAVITCGLTVAGIGMLFTGMASSFASAAAWRALTGIGSGASNIPVMALMAAWFVPRRRGMAAGIAVSGSSLALIVIGPLVPRILAAGGPDAWRTCWYVFAAATLALAAASALILRNRPRHTGQDPHPEYQQPPKWANVYKSAVVWHIGLVYVAFGFSYIIYITFFVKSLMADGHYTQQAAGSLFMTMGWCSLLCGLIWGTLSDWIGRKYALLLVYLVQTAAYLLFALWPTPHGFTISAILFGLTAWSIPAIMAAACGDLLGPRLAPAGLGFVTLFFGIGQALGPGVGGALADATGSLLPAFLLAAGVAFTGAIGTLFLRHSPRQ